MSPRWRDSAMQGPDWNDGWRSLAAVPEDGGPLDVREVGVRDEAQVEIKRAAEKK